MTSNRCARFNRRQFLAGSGAVMAGLVLQRVAAAAPLPQGPPDTVYLNGKVITVDAADRIVQAVAVAGDRIQAVGTTQEIQALAGPATQRVDLAGRTMTPGLIDAHNHFQVMGLMHSYYLPFIPPEVKSIPDLQRKLAEVAAQTAEGDWIKGYYWGFTEDRQPNRHDLDQVPGNHPIWLMQQGGHYGAANSLAMQIAGVSADTPNPSGGIIERENGSQPTGVFYNHRAMDLVRMHMPLYSAEMVRDNILSTQPTFAACGVTSFQDNNVRGVDVIHTYMEAGRQGSMFLRGAVYYTLEWPIDLDRALNEVERYDDPFMRMAGFKFLIDGQAPTAYCHEPHNGVSWDMPTWEAGSFKQAVRALHDTGLQICVHCAGDAAVDLTLDAYEEAMNANPRPDPRHRIEHCILSTPQATQRIKDLGVVVSTQPQFVRMGADYWATIFGPERVRRAIVTREWLDAGVPLALGSDSPTTPWYSPIMTLTEAVYRIGPTNKPFEPAQCLTIQEALRAHTMGSAYAAHEEAIKGSIEPGKLADLTVWSADPYSANTAKKLVQLTFDTTIVGGRVVYPAA